MKLQLNIKSIFKTLVFSIALILISCGNQKNSLSENTLIESDSNEIIFLSYKAEKTSDKAINVTFISKSIKEGKLKKNTQNKEERDDDFVCYQLDKKSNPISKLIIKNPLVKNFEYLDEDEKLTNKTVNLNKANFTIRLQLNSNTKYISIGATQDKEPYIKTKVN